jgi:peptidoglycan/LPS O-acetylase OafA/YrhL
MPNHKNAFDVLRVLFALFVFISHSYFLTGRDIFEPVNVLSKGQTSLADIGVMGFFSLSGYLITSSFDRSSNSFRFIYNRVLRIFPGFWVCLIVTAFVIAPLMHYVNNGSLTAFNYWGDGGALSYIYNNALLRINQWGVSNVTAQSTYKGSLNGSLWSLYPEMQCYLLTLITGLFTLFNKNKTAFLLLLVFVYSVYAVNIYDTSQRFGPTILTLSNARKLYIAYLCGAAMYVFRDKILIDGKGQVFILLFALLLLRNGGFLIAAPALIAMLAIKGFSNFSLPLKYDISYGLYIYAFPIQQLVFTCWGKSLGFAGAGLMALLLSCLAGLLSFVLIEKPFLRLKKIGLVQAEKS